MMESSNGQIFLIIEIHEKIEEEQEVLLVNVTDKEVLKAKKEELKIFNDNDVMEEIEKMGKKA